MALKVRHGPLQRAASFGAPLHQGRQRTGLDALLPERYHAWKSASTESLHEGPHSRKSRRAKAEKVHIIYDCHEVVARREALSDKVLHSSAGHSSRKQEVPEPFQTELIREWRLAEKQRAETKAEWYWKGKFLQWQRNHLAKLQHDDHAEEVAFLQHEIMMYEQDTCALNERQMQFEEDIANCLAKLEEESTQCAGVEAELQAAIEERNDWKDKAYSHEEKRKRLQQEQQDMLAKIGECYRHAASLGIPHGKGDVGFYEERKKELAAIKIQSVHRGRLARNRAAERREQMRVLMSEGEGGD